MSTIINTRSPYYIKYSATSGGTLESVDVNLRIWNGDKNSPPTAVTYQLSKEPVEIATNNYVVFEISELIRDFLETEYYTEAVDAVWVRTEAALNFTTGTTFQNDIYLALDGFGYFEEGINPRTSTNPTDSSYTPMILQSNVCANYVFGRYIRIPIFSETQPTLTTNVFVPNFWQLVDEYWEAIPNEWEDSSSSIIVQDSDDSADKIYYLIIDSNNVEDGDVIDITSTSGTGPAQTETITLTQICETRYDPIRAIFYNKFGALQDIWVNKKHIINTNVSSENYNRNLIDLTASSTTVDYDIYKHSKKRYSVLATQTIVTNTGLIDGCLNEPIEQMLMSEQIWLEFPTSTGVEVKPVVIKNTSQQRKTGVNDRALIQYTIEFDFAYNTINDIR